MRRAAHLFGALALLVSGCQERTGDAPGEIQVHGVVFSETEVAEILKLSPLPANPPLHPSQEGTRKHAPVARLPSSQGQGVGSGAQSTNLLRRIPPGIPPNPSNRFADQQEAALLGQFLFFDARLSANGKISCATCHQPARDWTDGKRIAEGLGPGVRNTPTLWNAAYQRWFFWDGRADSLWSQSLSPLESAHEMGGNRLRIYHFIHDETGVRAAYESIFGPVPELDTTPAPANARPVPEDPKHPWQAAWNSLTAADRNRVNRLFANVGKAIEAYERLLISTDAPFDRFVAGIRQRDRSALESLSPAALRGLRIFVGRGQCTLCHSGPNFTDREFHNLGLDRGSLPLDVGRFEGVPRVQSDEFNGLGRYSDEPAVSANLPLHYVAQKPNNLGEFKTPTLRNVAKTAPYMHDGRFADLKEVLGFYSRLNQEPAIGHREESLKPQNLAESETSDLIAFLETLDGSPLDDALLRQPATPGPAKAAAKKREGETPSSSNFLSRE